MRPVAEAMDAQVGDLHVPRTSVVVASHGDVRKARREGYKRIALMQHGSGQSYSTDHQSYPGGRDHGDVGLFLCPNSYSADRWKRAYPDARVEVTGSPRVEHLPRKRAGGDAVATSFHWMCSLYPETMPTFNVYRTALPSLRPFLGHGHPRAMSWLKEWYKAWGVEIVPDFLEVCRRADVYVCDNSSTIFEFAATGRPVVLLNGRYRKHVQHGGRFWDWASVGVQVDDPHHLVSAVRLALADPDEIKRERERIVKQVYPIIAGSTEATVRALLRWA